MATIALTSNTGSGFLEGDFDQIKSLIEGIDDGVLAFLDQDVTSGSTPTFTTTNMTSGTNKNFVTDAQLFVVGNTSNTNTGDQTTMSGISDTRVDFNTSLSDGTFVYTSDFPLNQDTTGKASTAGNADTVTSGVYTTDFPLNQDSTGTSANATLAANSTAWITMTSLQAKWFSDAANVLTFDETELASSITAYGYTTNTGTVTSVAGGTGLTSSGGDTPSLSHDNHTGEVTGSTSLTIASNVVDEANMKISNAPTNDYVLTADNGATGGWKWASSGAGYTNLTSFVDQTAFRIFYSNTSGDVTELALGADGTFLQSNGAAVAPTFETPAGGGDVSAVNSPVDNDFAKWTSATTIEGRSYSEVRTDLGLVIGTNVLAEQTIGIANDNLVEMDDADAIDNDYCKLTVNGIEGRSYSEVRTDLNIEDGSEANNISDTNATDLTDGGDTTLHDHDGIDENTSARHTQNTDTALGTGAVAKDHGTATTDQIVNVCYGTSATPPTASTTTEGTIYIQYTA